jgi:2-C-methyl-D-erythritol 2,4-cyclodiphosphate synthase
MNNLRIGIGYDVHAFAPGRELILGGVNIPCHLGLAGHSDADVLIHAVMDSLLGASSLGDIGTLFPDSDNKYKDISSLILLKDVFNLLKKNNWKIINLDTVIICQQPKISPFISEMKKNISKALDSIEQDRIGIKATTTEKLGFVGRKEGIAVEAVTLLQKM